jgi:thymidylate synthase (FAD)
VNIVQPYAKILKINGWEPTQDAGLQALRFVEFCARVSHASEDAQTPDSWRRFIEFVVMTKGDWSVTEHVNVTVDFLVDRGITHELVRHRLASYTQSSTRFINYEKKVPPTFIKPFRGTGTDEETARANIAWENAIECCAISYRELLRLGMPPQIARSVLPNALSSRIIVTANLRSWRQILIMRTTKETHPQFREVSIPLLREFQDLIPILYADIEPEQQQSTAIARPR